MALAERIQQHWRTPTAVSLALTPFSLVYGLVTKLRKAAYISGLLKTYRFDIPVVVVGNLTVGGTGKTPFVIWLANHLSNKGKKVGIICVAIVNGAEKIDIKETVVTRVIPTQIIGKTTPETRLKSANKTDIITTIIRLINTIASFFSACLKMPAIAAEPER